MLLFGLGTLPVMMLTGLLAGRVQGYIRNPRVRSLAALLVIGMGIAALWYALQGA
jgi:sulfite exporter TauE/SafE